MADLKPQERLQPALLDRLIDLEPDNPNESPDKRVLNKIALRGAVLRDLAWLLNSTRPSDDFLNGYPEAQKSVLNYGLPSLSGETAASLDVPTLEAAVRRAVLDFEPRIIAATLRVEAELTDAAMDHHNVIGLRISGLLWAQPVPIEMLLRTQLDLESGQVEVQDMNR
jgi:type VI secretion system protein ImpF